MKSSTAKPRPSLVPPRAVLAVATLMTEQAEAHNDAPGRPGYMDHDARAYVDSASRHLLAHLSGETVDESGATHLVCAAASLLIAVELEARR